MTLLLNILVRGTPFRTTLTIFTALLVAGCQTSGKRSAAPTAAATPAVAFPALVPPAVLIRVPIQEQASFALAKVVSGIRRGTTIATFPRKRTLWRAGCNASFGGRAVLDWATGTQDFGDWRSEFGDIFFDVLRDKGVNVVGDPKKLFRQDEAASSAEYLIGARIRELDGTFCGTHSWRTARPTGRFRGEFSIRIEWSVFSTLSKQTVARFETRGHFKLRKSKADGVLLAFFGAFSTATENLLTTREFVDLIERKPGVTEALAQPSSKALSIPDEVGEFSQIEIARIKQSTLAIRRIVSDVTTAVVSIRAGAGLGSGFMIDRAGLLLTNEHVVKSARRVQVVFSNGLEIAGTVIRRDPVHDVALVKIPLRARRVLPIRMTPAQRLEDVYAVGSPLMEALAGTVTRGIVSAWRTSRRDGLRHIQADVPISSGNSGGPLLDRFGNVIGISVAGYVHERAQNLNLFIPINDALEALNIVYPTGRKPSG
jgi:serine protease Do